MRNRSFIKIALIVFFAVIGAMFLSSCSKMEIEDPQEEETVISHTPEEKEFIENWENMYMVTLYNSSTGSYTRVNTPWNPDARVSTIPIEVANDVKKADGWEVVFNALSDPGVGGANYFGLYNYRLGIFRIFAYLDKPIGTGNECAFDISIGPETSPLSMYPLYNSLPYAVPTGYKNLNLSMDFFGKGMGNTFRVYASPIKMYSQSTESAGWTCFDVDMTGYNPDRSELWPTKKYCQMISIKGANRDRTTVTLAGTVSAKTSGKFVEQIPVQQISSSGISSFFKTFGGYAAGNIGKNICGFLGSLFNSKAFAENIMALGAVLQLNGNISDSIRKKIAKGEYSPKEVMDGMTGKLDLTTTGEVNLTGYLAKDVVSSFKPLQFSNSYVHVDNPSSHFGNGVWGLQESPVIYVVDDVMLGEKDRINLFRAKGSKQYANKDIENYGLRMIQFFDPTSVRVNLNTSIFPNPDSVMVSCFYGVYPNELNGHTSPYVKLLNLDRPAVTIFKDENTVVYRSNNPGNDIKYEYLPVSKLMIKEMGEKEENYNSDLKQVGSNFKYCGRMIDEYGKQFIIDPQVYFPVKIESNKTSLYDGECPDFVVIVTISFKHNDRWYYFTERYLPVIKKINRTDLKVKRQELEAYSLKCAQREPVNTLNNDNSINVYHSGNQYTVSRATTILKAIEK